MPRRPDLPCASCGRLLWRGTTSLPEGEATCQECRRAARQHGTVVMYNKGGCRCQDCRDALAAAQRAYSAERQRQGRPLKKARSKNRGNRYDLDKAQRQAIYDRDGWTCQLCLEPVDRTAHWNDLRAATLDHIEPQSVALIPNHSPDNLRLAHRICNARRGNRVGELAS